MTFHSNNILELSDAIGSQADKIIVDFNSKSLFCLPDLEGFENFPQLLAKELSQKYVQNFENSKKISKRSQNSRAKGEIFELSKEYHF